MAGTNVDVIHILTYIIFLFVMEVIYFEWQDWESYHADKYSTHWARLKSNLLNFVTFSQI